MQTRTVEQVESWESRPFSGGFHALNDLGDEEFTGAVNAGNAWLFMLNGRVVGVFDGTIDDFDGESGSIYEAPTDALPLLFSMQERGGDTRAKYFTNDTPLEEADQTLSDANFTGYIELSENVLSGDYYVVYYGGQKRSAAFIGQSERLVTGEDAFERAADEVGIYEVKDVSMNITEVPAPSEPEPASDSTDPSAVAVDDPGDPDQAADVPDAEPDSSPAAADDPAEEDDLPIDTAEAAEAGDSGPDREPANASESTDSSAEADSPEPQSSETSSSEAMDAGSDSVDERSAGTDRPEAGESEEPASADAEPRDATDRPSDTTDQPEVEGPAASGTEPQPESQAASSTEEDDLQAMFREEEEWRQTRSIPALDPDETEGERSERQPDPPRRPQRTEPSREPAARREPEPEVTEETIEELKTTVEERERQIDELASSMESVRDERNEMADELSSLREERDDLEERISNLESALQRAKDQQASIDPAATELSPAEALAGTNLFVRYDSKGKATLEVLEGGGEVDPEAVNANLTLDYHTQFESENAVVEGQEFETFLEGTSAYRFVNWLVRRFPYELLESGKRSALGDVYAAIPRMDRIEFEGTVDVETPDGGSTTSQFAVVVRDRMGNPLVVAELNDARDPVRGEEMADLVDAAVSVGDSAETLAGAFYVTASFFEPAALEEAEDAESTGGLFSRSDKASYVKTRNKSGFHLCLVEDRDDSFHVTVPEL